MTNPYHDERGRFCSARRQQAAIFIAQQSGNEEVTTELITSFNKARREALERAKESGNAAAIKKAKMDYMKSPEGIALLRESGRNELANKMERRVADENTATLRAERSRKPLRVGLDLDNTTGDFTGGMRAYSASLEGMSRKEASKAYPEPDTYDFGNWYSKEEFLERFHAAEEVGLYRSMEAMPGARRVLQNLAADGVEIHVVTARPARWNADTLHWLKKNRIPYASVTHTEDKAALDLDVYIDDSDSQLAHLAERSKTTIAMHALYNQDAPATHRVRAWDEVPAIIEQLYHARR